MKHIDYKGISLFQMETCISVARFGNITKAAAVLHSSQPAVSKIITRIEEELGYELFIRGRNTQLRMTPAGQYLCTQWERLLVDFQNSIDYAPDIQNDIPENLVIITTPSAQITAFIQPVISAFREVNPGIELRADNCSIPEAKERLCNETADIALVNPYLSELFKIEELEWERVACCPLAVGMLKTNPLAEKDHLTIADLKSQEFIFPQDSTYIRQITDLCMEKGGFAPSVSYYTKYFHGISLCLGANNEVFFTDKYMQSYYDENCAFFDLPEAESGVIMAWRKRITKKHTGSLLKIIRKSMTQCSPK
jgi:DNA-binding transcriptional LysR family regulator